MSNPSSSTEELFKQFLEHQKIQEGKKKKKNIKKLLHELATEGRQFYYDQNDNTYVEVRDSRSENPQATHLISIESSQYDRWLIREFNNKYDDYLDNNNLLKTIKILVSEEAKDSGRPIAIHNRIAMENDAIYIDIGCRNRKVIRIDKHGWDIGYYKVFFKRHKDMAELPIPERGGNIFDIIPFMPPLPKRDRCLALSWLIASFFPNIERAFLLVEGENGSGKTTLTKLLKSLIDPTNKGALAYKDNAAMMAQNIDHHCIPLIDNVTKISQSVSDLFCAAYSGGGDTKRKQYTDDEDFIFTLTGNLIFTAVHLKYPKSDFINRCYKIETAMTKSTYRSKQQFEKKFKTEKAWLFGAVLGAVSKTMSEVEKSQPEANFRTVDFDHRAMAAAEVIGYGKDFFREARSYCEKIKVRSISNNTPILNAIIQFLSTNNGYFEGRMTHFINMLRGSGVPMDEVTKNAAAFSKKINEMQPELKTAGVHAESKGKGSDTRWIFSYSPKAEIGESEPEGEKYEIDEIQMGVQEITSNENRSEPAVEQNRRIVNPFLDDRIGSDQSINSEEFYLDVKYPDDEQDV